MKADETAGGGVSAVIAIVAFWRWFWAGIIALAVLAGLTLGGWQAGWWFTAQNTTRQAQNTQNGYANQTALREQVTGKLAEVETITTQIAEAGSDTGLVAALKAQRMSIAGTACYDAAQITGTPLPAQQAQWVTANCTAGTVSPHSTYYQAGQP